jgi:hypothetical protein
MVGTRSQRVRAVQSRRRPQTRSAKFSFPARIAHPSCRIASAAICTASLRALHARLPLRLILEVEVPERLSVRVVDTTSAPLAHCGAFCERSGAPALPWRPASYRGSLQSP